MFDKKLLDILVCPVSKGALEYDEQGQELVCHESGLAYPIRDGIPVMLEDEARQIDQTPAVPADGIDNTGSHGTEDKELNSK